MEAQGAGVARGVVDSVNGESVVLRVPHTDYRLRLRVDEGAAPLAELAGKRVRGRIEAEATKIHPSAGGGRFIEPIDGEPRIIAGRVLRVEEETGRVLVEAAVPMWLEATDGQDFSVIRAGGMVNCYVRSGARFIPERG